jgi:hypothetical protein
MESYYSAREMAGMHLMYGRANGYSREARRLYAECYPQRRINNSTNFTSDWANLDLLLHGRPIAEGLEQFDLAIWEFACWEGWKKIPEPMRE